MPSTVSPTQGATRRSVLTAGAWSAPVVALAVAAPLAAASAPLQGIGVSALITYAYYRGASAYQWWTTSTQQFQITGLAPGTVISTAYIRYGLSGADNANLTFTNLGTNPNWSVPVKDGTQVINGVTFTMYRSTYTGAPVTATGTTVNLPYQNVRQRSTNAPSYTASATMPSFVVDRVVVVNGQTGRYRGGPVTMPNNAGSPPNA